MLAAPVLLALCWPALEASPAAASTVLPTASSWCSANASSVAAWVGSSPNLPICGPGPVYGGSWSYVSIPGPFGERGTYYNATPGFQCVELAERYLAIVDGLAAVKANGAQVAANYHAAYPETGLVSNGSAAAVGHAPSTGDVISFSDSPSFFADDGHVAVVVASQVDSVTGDGSVTIAQENVASRDYVRNLTLSGWRLVDPSEGGGTEYSYPYAEWLVVPSPISPALRTRLRVEKASGRRTLGRSSLMAPGAPSVLHNLIRT